tara:strand:+ start:4081 stop:4488 length:408 start_codon:yes stop_codon:yes gene_type:complete
MFNDLSDIQLLALATLANKEAKKRKSRDQVNPGSYSGEVLGIKYTLTVGEDTDQQGSDKLAMARFAVLLCSRLHTKLKAQKKAIDIQEIMDRSLSVDLDKKEWAGFHKEISTTHKNYLQSLERKARKGTVKAAIV